MSANPPWYPSLSAFEAYDSVRTRLFAEATFGGDFAGHNTVEAVLSPSSYPSGYNVVYFDADNIFWYGGGSGNKESSIGSYVAKIDPATLEPIWYTQLIDTQANNEWDYPGMLGLLRDGMLYVTYGYRLSKLDPKSGQVVATVTLPSGDAEPANTSYNGFNATAEGILVTKSIHRQEGCTEQGPAVLLKCPASTDSTMVSVDPRTMTIVDTVTLPSAVIGRPTVTRYQGKEYVYIFAESGFIRYAITAEGMMTLDSSWATGPLLTEGQMVGWGLVVIGDWVFSQCNGLPGSVAATVYAVHQGDASNRYTIQPFLNDPVPPLVKAVFHKAGPDDTQAISFVSATMSADPDANLIYMFDALPGKITCLRPTPTAFETVWTVSQTTTEFVTIIGPPEQRVIVTTEIPGAEVPSVNQHDEVVWRNAATGEELARSERLPAISNGTAVQPAYAGNMLYPGLEGALYKLVPAAKP